MADADGIFSIIVPSALCILYIWPSSINSKLEKTKEEQQQVIEVKKETFRKHDLAKTSYKKPKLVQNIINKATFSEFRCIENITKGNYNECK